MYTILKSSSYNFEVVSNMYENIKLHGWLKYNLHCMNGIKWSSETKTIGSIIYNINAYCDMPMNDPNRSVITNLVHFYEISCKKETFY